MLVQVNTPQVEVLQGVMDATKDAINSFYKDSKNLTNYQVVEKETAKDFSHRYLMGTIGINIENQFRNHNRVEADAEAFMCELFETYITGNQGDNVPYYFLSDGRNAVRVFNGRYFERVGQEEFGLFIKRVLFDANTSRVYTQKSHKPIADEVLKELYYTPDRKWKPQGRYLIFNNGVLDTEEMKLLPFSEEYQTNAIFDVDFNPDAKCSTFQRCLDDALDKEEQMVLQEACGYMLCPDSRFEKLPVLYGSGRNGKSAILRAVSYALGEDRVSHFNLSEMTNPNGIAIASSMNKIANICYDSGNVIKVDSEHIFKTYTSGEPLKAKVLYQQPMETTNYPKSIIAVNELPLSADFSTGYYRRFMVIPFRKEIPIEKVNVNLFDDLKTEQMGILLWIIKGYKRLMQYGFTECSTINKAIEEYRVNSDNVATYLNEEGWEKADETTEFKILYNLFVQWHKEYGGGGKTMSSKKFGERLRYLGYRVEKGSGNKTYVFAHKLLPIEDVKLPTYSTYSDDECAF